MPVFELDPSNAAEYLKPAMGLNPDRVSELAGGVSNTVLLVEHGADRFVLKQSLPQLRVEEDWFSDRRRILRECAALKMLAPSLPPGSVPQVIFEDPANFTFAMTAAPAGATTWQARLLNGETDTAVAQQVGALMGQFLSVSWESAEAAAVFGDLTIFEELRLSPYYGFLAPQYPDLADIINGLADSCRNRRVSLVHGDFSPKNFLVDNSAVTLIDWECIHYGNPAFDSAFVLNHLLLKSFHMPILAAEFARLAERFWSALQSTMPPAPWFQAETIAQWGGLLLARMDGKSPAEYIRDPELKNRIRAFARTLLLDPPSTVAEVFERKENWH